MAALPYIQIFPADYLADTAHLTLDEHGAYFLLILNYWQTGSPLRADDKRLASVCSTSVEKWLEIKGVLSEFFTVEANKSTGFDVWRHGRIDYELAKVLVKSTKARYAGKKSAEKRASKPLKENENRTNVQRKGNHTDTDTDTDTDKPLRNRSTCPAQKIVDLYHKILPELPQCKKLTEKRRSYMRARWNNGLPDLDHWEKFFVAIRTSPFLMGNTTAARDRTKPFIADLEWIINSTNYVKILEGKYHG